MYKLYWAADTSALAIEVVLEELGAPYERIPVDTKKGAHRKPDYLAINPMGQIPALRLPDGTILTESAAILLHLCDLHPDAGLLPALGTSARGIAYRWLLWMATGPYEADLHYYYPDRYAGVPEGEAGVKLAARERLDRLLDLAEATLAAAGPYLLGQPFTALDPYLLMLTRWHPDPKELDARCPAIARHAALTRARPSVQTVWPRHYPG